MRTFRLFAVIAISLIALTACGGSGSDVAGLESAETLWLESGIDSYTLEFTLSGGADAGPLQIEVLDGEIVGFENLGKFGSESMARTVIDLFDETRQVADDGVVNIAEFDPDLGYPTLLSFDPIPEGVDDEYTIEVISFKEAG